MIADTLRHFQFECCTHIPLLREMHAWAWRNHNLEVQIAAIKRLEELGAIKPRPRRLDTRDNDQKDLDEYREFGGY